MWGFYFNNRTGFSHQKQLFFSHPTWIIFLKRRWGTNFLQNRYFSGRVYIYLLKFLSKFRPLFFFSLTKLNIETKKKQYSPKLLYIPQYARERFAYSLFIIFFQFWENSYKNISPLQITPNLLQSFQLYYKSVLKRLVRFYLL